MYVTKVDSHVAFECFQMLLGMTEYLTSPRVARFVNMFAPPLPPPLGAAHESHCATRINPSMPKPSEARTNNLHPVKFAVS